MALDTDMALWEEWLYLTETVLKLKPIGLSFTVIFGLRKAVEAVKIILIEYKKYSNNNFSKVKHTKFNKDR